MATAGDVEVIEGLLSRGGVRRADGELEATVVDAGGRAHAVVGELGDLRPGTPVRLVTRRAEPAAPVAALRVVDVQLPIPQAAAEIERFLASGFFPGIGRTLARRLVEAFGDATLTVMETRPSRLAEVAGVGGSRLSAIAGTWAEHRHLQDVATLLRGQGVPVAFVIRMLRRHGDNVMFLPTPPPMAEAMLDLARVTPADHVVDLGAGDGAMVLAAARRGARATGVEANGELVAIARDRIAAAGLAHLADVVEGDLFTHDLADATVITLFLLPSVNAVLRPRLQALRPGTRIVANTWSIPDWPAHATVTLDDETLSWRTARLWITGEPTAREPAA